jgi:glycosyltransferase involved in cell wall biosynthesis
MCKRLNGGLVRILISLFKLSIGGSHINAIELGSLIKQRGHEVIVYATDGPLRERVEELGLEYVSAGTARRHQPSAAGVRRLNALVRERQIDLIHAYEWLPTLEAALGPHLRMGTPVLSTIYSVGVPRFVPRNLPMIVGYQKEFDLERRRGRSRLYTVVCPVDTEANAPVSDGSQARKRFGLRDDELAAVLVGRLSPDLKREGLLSAIAAAGLVDPALNLRLLIVGGGPCREEVQDAADAMNVLLGREAVTLTGTLMDPRDAYAAADIVLGMGTSAQKGMAFAKPVVIQGEQGYWETLSAQSMPQYLRHNFYGLGDGSDGAPRLAAIIEELARDRDRWPELGEFGRKTAVAVFSNEAAAGRVLEICDDVMAHKESSGRAAAEVLRASCFLAGSRVIDFGRRAGARIRHPGVATTLSPRGGPRPAHGRSELYLPRTGRWATLGGCSADIRESCARSGNGLRCSTFSPLASARR